MCSTARSSDVVDVRAREHVVAALLHLCGSRQFHEQIKGFASHTMFAVVHVQVARRHRQFGAAGGVLSEQVSQMADSTTR